MDGEGSKGTFSLRGRFEKEIANFRAQWMDAGKATEVWEHFKEVNGNQARCKYCQGEYTIHPTVGTSVLWAHLNKCKEYYLYVSNKEESNEEE